MAARFGVDAGLLGAPDGSCARCRCGASAAPSVRRHANRGQVMPAGRTVAEVLERVFSSNPRARGYILDDQGMLRKHVTVFVDGRMVADRERLTDPVAPGGEIYIMQALSGG